MREVNENLINKLFDELEKGNISPEECKKNILKEFQRVEYEWECQLGDMEDLLQSRE